ncbi:MAG: BadF/BadG/BcrA/BcrD ATPase family protein [Hyphomicrobium sp.]
MAGTALLLGVDGGGTGCRARLTGINGDVLGEGAAGPANIRFGIKESFAAVLQATQACLDEAGLTLADTDIVACLALAGASEPTHLAAARAYNLPFFHTLLTTDAHAACVGAHGGRNGGIVVVGTGSVGWGIVGGREYRVGGWGFPVSDEGSGAWLGCEAARRVLWAYDGRAQWTGLTKKLLERFEGDPHAIVRWMGQARPRDFAALAPLVLQYAARGDAVGCELMTTAAQHVDVMAGQLAALGVPRLALAGGLAASIEAWLAPATQELLVPPQGDALSGALLLARLEAEALALSRPAAGFR